MYDEMQFGRFRRLLSNTDRISMCVRDSGEYENYSSVREVPVIYDEMIVQGIGLTMDRTDPLKRRIESERFISFEPHIEVVLTSARKQGEK